MLFAVHNHIVDRLEHFHRVVIFVFLLYKIRKKAGIAPCMAGIPHLLNLSQKCIFVAVNGQRLYILIMSRGISLGPQLISAAAVISHDTGLDGLFKRFLCHISNHEHFIGLIILSYHG